METNDGVLKNKVAEKELKKTVAVALEYTEGSENVPKVTASGYGYIAQKILDIAFAKGIKVRQDADLAEILVAIDIDSDIPPEAFAAVAEILSYIYQVNASLCEEGDRLP